MTSLLLPNGMETWQSKHQFYYMGKGALPGLIRQTASPIRVRWSVYKQGSQASKGWQGKPAALLEPFPYHLCFLYVIPCCCGIFLYTYTAYSVRHGLGRQALHVCFFYKLHEILAGKPSISHLLVTTPASEDWCAKDSLFILPGCFLQCRRDVVTWLQRGPLMSLQRDTAFPRPGTLNVHLGTAMKAKAGMKPSA